MGKPSANNVVKQNAGMLVGVHLHIAADKRQDDVRAWGLGDTDRNHVRDISISGLCRATRHSRRNEDAQKSS